MKEESNTSETATDSNLAVSDCTCTEFPIKKNVPVIFPYLKGDVVTVSGWGRKLDGKEFLIEDVKLNVVGCESGILVKIDGYKNYLDSGWISRLK